MRVLEQASALPRRTTIIVGAGSAGSALAARLSEDPARSVLVLEAGPVPRSVSEFPPELLDASTVIGATPGHPANWSSAAQLTDERSYSIARGRIAGGSSTINGGYFVRARPEDFARWALRAGPAWEYASVLPLLREIERDLDLGAGPFHGDSGPIPIRRAAQTHPIASAFSAAAEELGFPVEPDKNAPGAIGVGALPRNVLDGVRVNTALAYLVPVLGRANLEVRGGRRVRRVLFEGTRAIGVETAPSGADEADGTLTADEIVLCAGGIGTPHLLLASGIGPAAQLAAVGVPVIRDAPGVGRAFSDHPNLWVGWRSRDDLTDPAATETFTTVLNVASAGADPAGDLEILACIAPLGRLQRQPTDPRDLALLVGLQRADSRGSIELVSADPEVDPRIEYRYLSTRHDRARLRLGIRTSVALLRSDAFATLYDRLTDLDDATLDDDAALDDWIRAHLGTALHLCGSVPMGAASDPYSVVDGSGRVRGVAALRVADTSILPDAPSRGPAATAVLIGELVARFIRRGQ